MRAVIVLYIVIILSFLVNWIDQLRHDDKEFLYLPSGKVWFISFVGLSGAFIVCGILYIINENFSFLLVSEVSIGAILIFSNGWSVIVRYRRRRSESKRTIR